MTIKDEFIDLDFRCELAEAIENLERKLAEKDAEIESLKKNSGFGYWELQRINEKLTTENIRLHKELEGIRKD